MTTELDQDDFTASWEHWHREHERERARPLGFLAITSLHWLEREPRRFDDVPGAWSLDADGVHVSLGEGDTLIIDDRRVSREHHFGLVDERGVRAKFGDALVEVARRGEQFMIRPRHPDNVVRTSYQGTSCFAPRVDWVATGSFIAYVPPRSITVGASVEGLEHVYSSPGEVEFELAGRAHRLVAFNDGDPDELFIVFSDLTAGTDTYRACRFLTARIDGDSNEVALDFNRATNPPCAYARFATCPLPPPSNQLSVRVEAGEKAPAQPGSSS